MEITLKAKKGELEISKYSVDYPFSVHKYIRNGNKILRTTSSLSCKDIQGSSRLNYSRKIDFTAYSLDATKNTVAGGELSATTQDHDLLKLENTYIIVDTTAKHYLLFPKKIIHVNENSKQLLE